MTPKTQIIYVRCAVNDSGCWVWQGNKVSGYGRTSYRGKLWMTHRVTYTEMVGEIPYGLELDHKCMNRACCNPDHLEAVTRSENLRRGYAINVAVSKQRSKTHCPLGHPYNDENTYVVPSTGHRQCRECKRIAGHKYARANRELMAEKSRRWRERKKGAAA